MEEKYALVAQLVGSFHIPNQALIFWLGSGMDRLPIVNQLPAGVINEDIMCSAHHSPSACLEELQNILGGWSSGVIIAIVGMSNGLGPLLSARTSWPVLGVCSSAKEHPEDVWSNLRLPSNVPMGTFLSADNAVQAALNILAQNNPAVYAERQYAIEELDK